MSCAAHAPGDRCLHCGHGIAGPETSILHDRYRVVREPGQVNDVERAPALEGDALPFGERLEAALQREPEEILSRAANGKPIVYTYSLGYVGNGYRGRAIAQDGTVLYEHISSTPSWLHYDLASRGRKRFEAHYPGGLFVARVHDPERHIGLQAALAREKERTGR